MEEKKPTKPDFCPSPVMLAIRELQRVNRRHRACIGRQVGDLDIHRSQHQMLMHLAHDPHVASQRELAAAMAISPAAVTNTLKPLERDGYIVRAATDEDNRRNEIHITDKGRDKIRETHELFAAVDNAMFAGFTPEDVDTLRGLLDRLNANLDRLGAPACDDRPLRKPSESPES